MKYTIEWMEKKKWQEKNLIDATLVGVGPVTIWEDQKDGSKFPGYDDLMPGGTVEGNVWTNPTNGKKSLYPEKPKTGGAYKQKVMDEAMTRKETGIEKTLDRKEESIRLSAAQRDAVLIVTNFCKDLDEEEIKTKVVAWRDWFLSKEFTDIPPFQ